MKIESNKNWTTCLRLNTGDGSPRVFLLNSHFLGSVPYEWDMFLYSQDLSNYKTQRWNNGYWMEFLYSQDLSNYKTETTFECVRYLFLYSQDLSNYKTRWTTLLE